MEQNYFDEERWYVTSISNPRLADLYQLVDDYTKRNLIGIYVFGDGFLISYKGEGYSLDRVYGPDVLYTLSKLGDCNSNYIEIENVLQDKLTPKQQDIKDRIERIKYEIAELEYEGVSKSLIKKYISGGEY